MQLIWAYYGAIRKNPLALAGSQSQVLEINCLRASQTSEWCRDVLCYWVFPDGPPLCCRLKFRKMDGVKRDMDMILRLLLEICPYSITRLILNWLNNSWFIV
jgi:hypothetical protein